MNAVKPSPFEALARYAGDPVAFCTDILRMRPHEGQVKWLLGSTKHENALVTGNRWGKSQIAAAKRIWKCLYNIGWDKATYDRMKAMGAGYQSINVSLTQDQANIVWLKALQLVSLPTCAPFVHSKVMSPFPTINFINGAVFQARSTDNTGSRLLGHDYDDVNWDEAAYEPKFLHVRDNVIRMRTVDRNGSIDYTSTGNGRNDFGLFYLAGLDGTDKDLYAQTGSTYENPYIDHDALDREAKRMPERMRRQNIDGAIVDTAGDYFSTDDYDACQDEALDERILYDVDDQEQIKMMRLCLDSACAVSYTPKYQDHFYVHGWDLADKTDYTTGFTYDASVEPALLVEFERFNKRGWSNVLAAIRDRHRRYGGKTAIDCTGVGDVVLEQLSDIRAEGIVFTKNTKDEILANLQTMLNLRQLRFPTIKVMRDEHIFYQRDDANLMTDCVMGNAIAAWFLKRAVTSRAYGFTK